MILNHSNFKLFYLQKASANKQHRAGKKFYQKPLFALCRNSGQFRDVLAHSDLTFNLQNATSNIVLT
ncbi:hypothetical protein CWB69_12010 [Pseudoalteromonas sp. S980]|nr:hypothetical protein J139_13830 [Pseudoalteromonas agarivorans S816]TMS64885.1 hypothetical protein CWB83_15320 [Pseudoalteromonas sp. S1691]TMS67819.1 hypothetical protein CWB86_13925 [Pseudoalteromonas sp. S1731]TMS76105.1 hypothetical protein CWB82_17980 [Pseudoalteromonas sp. S1690]TMS89048.1 hypothetical protein CWB69_12010 [Pseudoalteromonas sp. S980]